MTTIKATDIDFIPNAMNIGVETSKNVSMWLIVNAKTPCDEVSRTLCDQLSHRIYAAIITAILGPVMVR